MPYQGLEYDHIKHRMLKKILLHSDMLLRDLYGIFKLPIDKKSGEGAGNFSILIILLCIIDGLAVYIYPTRKVKDQEKRFKKLINEKLYWGPVSKSWLEKGLAAKQFYLELLNPLVHELGADKITSARMTGYLEPRIGKWGNIDEEARNIEVIENMKEWNDNWPTLTNMKDESGEYIKFNGAAFYWSVKKMITELINDETIINNAIEYLDNEK